MRKIKLSESDIDNMLAEFKASLLGVRFDTDKVTYCANTKIDTKDKKTLYLTPESYCKMTTLVRTCDKEIAWHGTVEKLEDGNYIITDILVYPQEIAGATVTSNDDKYPMWLMQQPDEIFNKLRFQGHSHVNFGATPSATDLALYNNMLQSLDENSENNFYIFFILNKKSDFWVQIYDLSENLVYEKTDINVEIVFNDDTTTQIWYEQQFKENIVERKVVASVKTNTKDTVYSKYTDKNWRWDFTRKCYVPTKATEKQIKSCFDKAKKQAKNKSQYDIIATSELETLYKEIEEFDDELEKLALQKMDDDLKKKSKVAQAIAREQMAYWDDYYGG